MYSALSSPLFDSVTSSTKPEVHNISQHRQTRTERPPQKIICAENWIKFGLAVFEIYEKTERQTDILRQYFAALLGE